jgi:hypothetical protein
MEFISTMNWENINSILKTISLKEDTISKLESINTTGYDLCIEPKKFLSSIGINNQHEQNSILRKISPYINEQLNISFYYNGKFYKIQLENDINYTIEMLISSIKPIFNINDDLFLCPFSNEQNVISVLLPNFKIVEKIFQEPEKYTSLMKFSYNDNNYIPIIKEINEEKKYIPNEEIINYPNNTIQCKEIFIKNDINSENKNNLIKTNYINNQNEEIKSPNNNIIDNYFQGQKTIKLDNESFSHIKRNTKRKDDGINISNYNYDDTLNKTEKIFNRFNNENINNISQNNINENNIIQNNINENNISQNNINENNMNENNINDNNINNTFIYQKSEIYNTYKNVTLKDQFKNMKDEDILNKTAYSVYENDKYIDINNNSILNKENKKLLNNKSLNDLNLNKESYKYSKKLSYPNSLNTSNSQIKQLEIQREKDREELNTYIKKGYGVYPLEGTKLFSISTDRRNYRITKSNTPDNKIEKNKLNTKGESNLKDEINKKVNSITIKLNHTPDRKKKDNEIILSTNSNNNYVYKSKYLNEMISKNSDKDIHEIKINK